MKKHKRQTKDLKRAKPSRRKAVGRTRKNGAAASRVPRRFRGLAGVDPRMLAAGVPYPCDDPRVGTVVPGGRSTPGGRVVACASRGPEGRGHDLFVGGMAITPRQIAAARVFAGGEARRAQRRAERPRVVTGGTRGGRRRAAPAASQAPQYDPHSPRPSAHFGPGGLESARRIPLGYGAGGFEDPRPIAYGPRESLGVGALEPSRSRPVVSPAEPVTTAAERPSDITVTFRDGAFVVLGNTRPVWRSLKEAGFATRPDGRGGFLPWQTKNMEVAAKLRRYMDPSALLQLEQRDESIAASRQAVGVQCSVLPAPPGRSYMPFQCAGIQYALAREGTLIGDDMGLGKAQPVTAKVLTPTGWRAIGELRVGDRVIGASGKPTSVTGVFPRGSRSAFRVTLSDGATTECCDEHLWAVQTPQDRLRRRPARVKTLAALCAEGLTDAAGNHKWFVPMVAPIEMPESSLPVAPYALGAILANGALTGSSVRYSGDDEQTELLMVSLRPRDGITAKPCSCAAANGCRDWRVSGDTSGATNHVINDLRELDLWGADSAHKKIPDQYLHADRPAREQLLRGLMDNDGTVSKDGMTTEYNTVSADLARGVCDLVRSLGGSAWMSQRTPSYPYLGEKRVGQTDYRVRMSLPAGVAPFSLTRKADRYKPRSKYPPSHAIHAVEPIGQRDMVCIAVDADDHLYVTDDYIVTHNTVQALGVVNADPSIQSVIVVCPASLRTNWRREAERWLVRPFNIYVVEGNEPVPADANFVILNYEILITRTVVSGTGDKKTRREAPSAPFASVVARSWDMLVVDEAHRIKNEDAKQTIAIVGSEEYDKDSKTLRRTRVGLVQRARRRVFLTGTPLPNRPIELWPIVHALSPETFPNRYKFSVRYANGHRTRFGWDESGASNLEELQNLLRSTIMVRRLKTQVLTELPPKRREVVLLPAEIARDVMLRFAQRYIARKASEQLRRGLEDFDEIDWTEVSPEDFVDRLIAEMDSRREAMERARAAGDPASYEKAAKGLHNILKVGFEEMSDLRREIARKKVPALVEFVREQLAGGVGKIVVMAHHHEVQDALVKAFAEDLGAEAVVLHRGGLDNETKQGAVDRFQNDPRVRVFVGSILASGVGITLTAASTMVFAELDWVPGNMTQAEDRIYRIGQALPVTIYHLVVDGTLDAKLVDTLIQKQAIADSALDTERAAILSEVLLPEARGPKSPLEQWAATTIVGLANGSVVPQREPNGFARREIPSLARSLLTGRGLFDGQWRLAVALAMRASGGSMTRVSGGTPRPPANNVERWAADAIRQLAGDDSDYASEKNGIGFMAGHTSTGHTLAALIEAQSMTDENWREAVSIAKRYPRQVGAPPRLAEGPRQNPRAARVASRSTRSAYRVPRTVPRSKPRPTSKRRGR